MKRLSLLLLGMALAICATAQFKGSVSVVPQEYYRPYQIAFNFSSVCKSMGVTQEEFAPILDQWLNVNRDKNTVYENMKMVYMTSDANQPEAGGDTHGYFMFTADGHYTQWGVEEAPSAWGCNVTLDLKMNILCFNVYFTPSGIGEFDDESLVKVGDCLQASFAVAYGDKVATFDVAMNLVADKNGTEIPLLSLDKVGEKEVSVKYSVGKSCITDLNLDSIATCFGEGVRGGNLQLYVYAGHDKKMLTDRYTYELSPAAVLEDNCVVQQDPYNTRYFVFSYCPVPQYFTINPHPDVFADGEHATGSVFLVANDKYFELKLDVQFGDSEQEERNMSVVAAAEQCGKFTRTLNVEPEFIGSPHEVIASFNLVTIAKALGTDCDELLEALKAWKSGKETADGTEMVYNLSDHASTKYTAGIGGYNLDKEGKVISFGGNWGCQLDINTAMRELRFLLFHFYDSLKDGDVCNVQLGLYYKGRMVELEITLNVKEGNIGELIALSGLKKVGEQVVSGIYADPNNVLKTQLNLDSIASLFDGDVIGKALKLYVISDAEKQLLTDRYSYETAPCAILNIESTEYQDYSSYAYYSVSYFPYQNLLAVSTHPDAFKGGQKTSGSVFLVANGQYYELLMDVQFGTELDEKSHLNILATEQMDVYLMLTDDYYSYINRQTGERALIQSAVDMSKIEELLGTENPVLYAEQMQDGQLIYTCHYNAAPGQGFWFAPYGHQAYRSSINGPEIKFGMYYSDGSFKWYGVPFGDLEVGETYTVNLYFTNAEKDTAVKYIINVTFVNEINNANYCHVRHLPIGLDASTGIEENVTMKEFKNEKIYNLDGQRINSLQKGLNIVDGKKIWVK